MNEHSLRWYHRYWYTFKASICVLLSRFKEGYFCQDDVGEVLIDVCMWDFRRERGGIGDNYPSFAATWNQISVAKGSWHVHIFSNANY